MADHRLLNVPMNLNDAERLLVVSALTSEGSIVGAAELLGITRHGLKRRIIKHQIRWPQATPVLASAGGPT